ncbi:MAG TPA: hypothetical protein VFW22_03105 [Pseudolabrys sp.]|nr:hypothetical protein [Pseudolabrys sp.]
MRWIAILLALVVLVAPARAENCTRSREYLMEGLAGDLPAPPAQYQELFKVCMQTLSLANVRDAYLLRDGGIAIVPKRDSLIATAGTLAHFCEQFPRGRARFVTAADRRHATTVGLIVLLSSTGSASCTKIRGLT